MEKSIENIWKEGFLKSDALVAPKIITYKIKNQFISLINLKECLK